MADYKVRAVWDIGNAAQFEQGIKSTVNSSTAAVRSATAVVNSPAGETSNILTKSEAAIKSYYSNVRPAFTGLASTISDPAVNASLVRSIGLLDSQIGRVRQLRSEFDLARRAAASPEKTPVYQAATTRITEAKRYLENDLPGIHQLQQQTYPAILAERETALAAATKFYKGGARNPATVGQTSLGGGYYAPTDTVAGVEKARAAVAQLEAIQQQEIAQARQAVADLIAVREAEVVKLKELEVKKNLDLRTANAEYVAIQRSATAELQAFAPPVQPALSPQLSSVLQRSPQAEARLRAGGFGVGAGGERPPIGTADYAKILSAQGAEVTKLTTNAATGITTLGVRYKTLGANGLEAAGAIRENSLAIQQNGLIAENTATKQERGARSVKETGDAYSGLGRVIQRTVEYAAVAAVTYGAFNAAIGQVKNINELNAGLARLSVTSELTRTDVDSLFDSLTGVAYQTATPLNEIVKSADDIALAVKEAGQSTEEYKQNIISLTQAVGILTNLSGIDTVSATDKLTSAFKQLGVAPSDLIGILNQVTAVAGGQSKAIADIVTGLGSVSAAAHNAGLSTQEMIASIQVLSQVTDKSPDEVAISFKNIFGSLIGRQSIKTLHEFGIEAKDAAGNVRPFLTVIGEVYDAIQKGVIPEGQVAVVERAIAGGPRRAPDVAAIVENYPRIAAVTQQAIGATNEALVANAKILDTNQAKIIQLGVALESTVFKTFGETVNRLVGALLDLGIALTHIIEIVGPFGPMFLTAGATVLALVAASKVLTGVLSILARTFGLARTEIAATTTAIETQGAASVAAGTKNRGFGASLGGLKGGAAAFGLGAALSTATGGNAADAVGGGLTFLGTRALFANPLLGIGAIAAGQILPNILGSHKEDEQAQKQDQLAAQQALVQNIEAYRSAQREVSVLADKQLTLGNSIDQLLKVQKPSEAQTNRLIGLQEDYAKTVLESADANETLKKSFADITPAAANLRSFVQSSISGNINASDLDKIKSDAVQSIILATSPDFQKGGRFFGEDVSKILPYQPSTASTFVPPPTAEKTIINPDYLTPGKIAPINIKDVTDQYLAGLRQIDADVADGLIDGTEANNRTAKLVQFYQDAIKNANDISSVVARAPQAVPVADLTAYNKTFADKPYVPENAAQFEAGRKYLPPAGPLIGTNTLNDTEIDLAKIATGAESVKDIFSNAGDKIVAKFTLSNQAVAAVNAGIDILKAKGDPLAATYEKTWQSAISLADTYSYTLTNVARNIAIIQAQQELGIITDEEAKKLTAIQKIRETQASLSLNAPDSYKNFTSSLDDATTVPQTRPGSRTSIANVSDALIASPNSAAAQKAFADEGLKALGVYQQLLDKGPNALANAESKYIEKTTGLTSAIKVNTAAEKESAEVLKAKKDAIDAVNKGYASEQGSLIDRRTGLESQIQGEQFKPANTKEEKAAKAARLTGYREELDQVNALINVNNKLHASLLKIAKTDPGGLEEFKKQLSSIHGLENIVNVDNENLASSILALATQMGLTGEQVEKLGVKLAVLGALAKALDDIKATIEVEVQVGVAQLNQIGKPGPGGSEGNGTDVLRSGTGNQLAAYASGRGPANDIRKSLQDQVDGIVDYVKGLFGSGKGSQLGSTTAPSGGGGAAKKKKDEPNVSLLDYNEDLLKSEQLGITTQKQDLATIIANAKKLQSQIPGQKEKDKNDIVEILNGTKKVAEVRGISEELLRKSMDELADIEKKRLDFDTKADVIRRVRIGSGDFSAIANVPFNSKNQVSVGGPNGPITVNLNMTGTIMTPAQAATLGNMLAAQIKQAIAASK